VSTKSSFLLVYFTQTNGTYNTSISEFGSSVSVGTMTIYGNPLEPPKYTFGLRKGSIWTTEWSPTMENISLGVDASALIMDTKTNKMSRVHTNKSDVFSQCWNVQVSTIIFIICLPSCRETVCIMAAEMDPSSLQIYGLQPLIRQ
jgi:hypothetical protein